MMTKLLAAQKASHSGASTVIAGGKLDYVLEDIYKGKQIGTLLSARENRINAKKQWLAGQRNVSGTVVVDDGAAKVLQQAGSSLLPVGVIEVQGIFKRGELIVCKDKQGKEIARGLSNYSSEETRQIMGLASSKIESVLNYGGDEELIHRDNMVLA
jgi:glutamate 5-kinase